MNTVYNTNFKAEPKQTQSIFYNSTQRNKAPALYSDDSVELQMRNIEKDMQKKQNNLEKWQKWGVIGTCSIGAAFLISVSMQIAALIRARKGDKVKVVWEDFSKKANLPKLTDDCVNEKVRDFINNIKSTSKLSNDIMKRAGIDYPEQCIIMWGPSGTGKSLSAKILAREIGAEYSEVQFADVSSPYIGQTAVEIKAVFKRLAEKLRKNPNKKFVMTFNEVDALLVPREKCGSNNLHLAENRTAFLNGLDQIKEFKNITIIGTTNVDPASGNLDKASLSRFGNILKIDLPSEKEIIASLKFHLNKSEDVRNGKFFENNKSAIKKLAEELRKKKYAHRDIEDIAAKARMSYGIELQEGKTKEFKLDYIKSAIETKGKPVGAIGEYYPIWERANLENPEFENIEPKKAISFWAKLFGKKQK